ncbi:unnamed protein product [Rotaria sp. Silwood2]|nr:unnamed protein product [Rotaria sp. Silwood2]CAF3016805.1 unnamed protein product [Rotaria sp. Silwood2]CAF3331672.1 unnamed protein product [Rotaria sp. Silwood2]CAF4463324.1 unnamed protein product [Rotaria sp. Silwood2]CAF4510679.1 unnamed protein product [Rotaria sp. Silwood2]
MLKNSSLPSLYNTFNAWTKHESIINQYQYQTQQQQQHQEYFDMHDILHSSILLLLLSFLSSITLNPYRKQIDLISTSLSSPSITTINNPTIIDHNYDQYY